MKLFRRLAAPSLVLWLSTTLGMGETSPARAAATFEFREPLPTRYRVEMPITPQVALKSGTPAVWLRAWPENGSGPPVQFGDRVVLALEDARDLIPLLEDRPLEVARILAPHVFILQAPDAAAALEAAAFLAKQPRVAACYPVTQRPAKLFRRYARQPNDPYFARTTNDALWQPYLENRDTNGTPLGVDLNVRAAWPISRGRGVTIAIGDDGIELTHPDLAARARGAPHFNFIDLATNGMPTGPFSYHGTAVAGLAAATGDNQIGISGVAPEAQLASWVLFGTDDELRVSDERMFDMFQYQSNVVSIQNHSWGKDNRTQLRLTLLESMGLTNAVALGRSGLGTVIIRAGGNGRMRIFDMNDDGYANDPRVIAVAAIRLDGRVARYSTPGACLLVAAPSGDVEDELNPCGPNSPNLLTTDLRGANGVNAGIFTNDLADYMFGPDGFSGTSAATPQIAGLSALILAANPTLTYRDVQQILIHSSRHFDLADPGLRTNAAGFRVSHNLGFGVPDAGLAVALAQTWPNRPPLSQITYDTTNLTAIPDQTLRVLVQGQDVPTNLLSIVALPGLGLFPDSPTLLAPLVDVGITTNGIAVDLSGRAALIQRGGNYFCEKLSLVETAGAAFAVVYNNVDSDGRLIMGATEFSAIPAVFITQNDGEALQQHLRSDPTTRIQLSLQSTPFTFSVKETLLCEHLAVRIDTDHSRRGDLRLVLVSPSGTRSVLQNINNDDAPGPIDWTYYSTHHFYESSAGVWTVLVSDLDSKGLGNVKSLSLTITGVPILDRDRDGLDDDWELRHFNTLAFGPQDDPDQDGYINSREQITGTNPAKPERRFDLDLSLWDNRMVRLSWPGATNNVYQVKTGNEAATLLHLLTNVAGRFPETEWFTPYTNLTHQFFGLEALPTNPAAR